MMLRPQSELRNLDQTSRLVLILLVGVLARATFFLLWADHSGDYYWEYGDIAKNLHAGNGYSLSHSTDINQVQRFDPSSSPNPSAYMPPGYVFFLWPFFFIADPVLRNVLLVGVQIAISALVGIVLYSFTERFVRRGAGIWAIGIYMIAPEFIYATTSFTPTVPYHLGIITLLYVLQPRFETSPLRRSILVAVICVLMIFLRSEFVLFALIATFLLARLSSIRYGILCASMILLLHLPWQIRNYTVFHEWIPLTTSGGLNFFRGHNGVELGAWGDEFIEEKIKEIPDEAALEPELNRLYYRRALEFIRTHPLTDLANATAKAFHLWVFNPNDARSRSFLYLIPWFGMLLMSLIGIMMTRAWVINKPATLFLFYSTVIAILFFVLPRYQSMMKVVLVPFAAAATANIPQKLREIGLLSG